jgi:NADP-dependent 3-hydroxy acid dehydrogenase YdfG
VSLDGRRALVTGASRGIGAAIARALDGAGARTLLVARDVGALQALVGTLARASAFAADLRAPATPGLLVREAASALGGPVDVLVNNAGAFAVAPIAETPDDALDDIVALNLTAPFRMLRAFVPGMRHCATAHIVTIGSVADRVVMPGNAAYAASKFGARALHEAARAELRGTDVRVTLVSPGPTDTPLWDPVNPDAREGFTPRRLMLSPDAVADAVLWALTRPRGVNVDELRLSHS